MSASRLHHVPRRLPKDERHLGLRHLPGLLSPASRAIHETERARGPLRVTQDGC